MSITEFHETVLYSRCNPSRNPRIGQEVRLAFIYWNWLVFISQGVPDLELNFLRDKLLLANMSPEWFIRAVHRSGRVILDTETLDVDLALFDSGAIGASFISEHFVNKHFSVLEPYIEKARGRARLAADDHEEHIRRSLLLPF